jgi:phosphomethylpyrimidine synthase
MASKLAAHVADLAKGLPGAFERDAQMARYRKEFNWQGQIDLSIDPERAAAWLEKSETAKEEGCTMCGELCAIKLGKREGHRMF